MDKYIEKVHSSWLPIFEKHRERINKIFDLIDDIYPTIIYPPSEQVFKVFEMDVKDIKIVLLGQDSYHGPGQANGMAFSVNLDIKIPPSLVNIYKELKNTYPERNYEFEHGNLNRWFYEEKIFLLNCGLSVIESRAGSLLERWTPFTDDIIKFISEQNNNCIFLLFGNYAKDKMKYIQNKDNIICGVHPSPLSANRGFLGSKIFKEVDEKIGYDIDWRI